MVNPLKGAQELLGRAVDWFLPPLCPATGEIVDSHGMVAPEYWASLRFIGQPYCPRCASPFGFDVGAEGLVCGACLEHPPLFGQGRAAVVYDDASRRVILRFKHGDQLQAIRTLVPWMMRAGADVLAAADVIVPVPLHRWRLLKRRYNQSALLAAGLAKQAGKRSIADALIRVRHTLPQAGMKHDERARNVKGAFVLNRQFSAEIQGKNILLVDDVLTTGATLNACTKALLAAGAAQVNVLCVARAVKD